MIKVYDFCAYNEKIPVVGQEENFKKGVFQMIDMVEVQVHAENEEDANKKVKEMIKKKYYQLRKVWSHEENDLREEMQLTQLEIQKKMLDFIKGNR